MIMLTNTEVLKPVAKPASKFGYAMANFEHYHYSFFKKFLVFTAFEHENVCIT